MWEISTVNNPSWLSILNNENLKPKWILDIKVFPHCNKGGRCIFHLSHCLQKNICNIWHVEISAFFINFSQKLQSLKSTLAVKFYHFLTEYQNSMSSSFFLFWPRACALQPKIQTHLLKTKQRPNSEWNKNTFFLFINICINEPMPTSLVSPLL